ncbi:MAG TPA: ATP synthase subunit I [Elainellaceae cyanobacterium]
MTGFKFVNSPDHSLETPSSAASPDETSGQTDQTKISPDPDASMQEYFRLQRELLIVTFALAGIIFISVWAVYSLNTALNYVIGACTGVVYLRLLAKNVEQLGRQRSQVGSARLALIVGLVVVASRLNQLEILPIFLGFLTYKAALMIYVLRTALIPDLN